jgi:hypothetical protein
VIGFIIGSFIGKLIVCAMLWDHNRQQDIAMGRMFEEMMRERREAFEAEEREFMAEIAAMKTQAVTK